jgi:heme/copper-type cytochrome/quinol oxidase subunit 4
MMHDLTMRICGFSTSLALTFAAYFIILDPSFFYLSLPSAVAVIIGLAFIQAFIQLLFFIDVWHEKEGYWNLTVFVSTSTIIFIVVFFSIWIMEHLNYNMR